MKAKLNTFSLLLLTGVLLTTFSFTKLQNQPREVPAKYKKMENPTKASKDDMEIAKQLYDKHCKSCHGKAGLGDGPKAKELDTKSGDFSKDTFQVQADGDLFYKTTVGRDDMPAFDKKIADDNDRWLLVHYMRTFKK